MISLPTQHLCHVQVADVVECCTCLCKAVCAVVTASYGPCSTVKRCSEYVHGVPAHIAVQHMMHMQDTLADLHSR